MKISGYEFRNYVDEDLPDVAGLLKFLWGGSLESYMSFFTWKYRENPFSEGTVGIVCLSAGSVVGFKSFYPTRWEIGNQEPTVFMLSPTDTVIHPDHRRMGLFTEMTKRSIEQFQETRYAAFINLSSNQQAAAGNMKLGWVPLCTRGYLRYYSLTGLLHYFLIRTGTATPRKPRIAFGRFGNIEVSDIPRPEHMCRLIRTRTYDDGKIRLYKDEEYLTYRFRNPRKKYVFYYLWQDGVLTGYVVIKPLQHSNNAHILDYDQTDSKAVQEIVRYIIATRHYGMISVWNCGLENDTRQILQRSHFRTNAFFEKIERSLRGTYYILVRPTRKKCTEESWFLGEINMRDIDSWHLNEFCSDPD
jgi:hypothetical protein